MSPREKMLVLLLGLITVWVGGLFYLVIPRWQELSAVWQSVQALKTQNESLMAQEASLKQQITDYGNRQLIPKGIQIRAYSPETYDKSLKVVLDTLTQIALENGNLFISLEPDKVGDSVTGKEPQKTEKNDTTTPRSTAPTTASQPPALPATEKTQLKSFGYRMTFRGTYNDIIGFLNAIASLPEVLGIRQIDLINEIAPIDTTLDEGVSNPLKPLRLDVFVQIFMAENPESIPDEYLITPTAAVSRKPLKTTDKISQIHVSPSRGDD
ncbi:MAG: hypothetical protein VKK59_03615 [Vampirovibrionales bacterium]|nr:hypothetical protein [Vampirovibrionales bacterium]